MAKLRTKKGQLLVTLTFDSLRLRGTCSHITQSWEFVCFSLVNFDQIIPLLGLYLKKSNTT